MNNIPPPASGRPATDLLTRLGHMSLGSRLKRLGEAMQSGVAAELARRGLAVQPAQVPLLVALDEGGPMTVGALGAHIGISQPGVTRALARLETLGLVAPADAAADRRRRPVRLTEAGTRLIRTLQADLLPAVDRAVRALCAEPGGDFLAIITALEDALRRSPLDARIDRTSSSRKGDTLPHDDPTHDR